MTGIHDVVSIVELVTGEFPLVPTPPKMRIVSIFSNKNVNHVSTFPSAPLYVLFLFYLPQFGNDPQNVLRTNIIIIH